jgi:hypothetical protein
MCYGLSLLENCNCTKLWPVTCYLDTMNVSSGMYNKLNLLHIVSTRATCHETQENCLNLRLTYEVNGISGGYAKMGRIQAIKTASNRLKIG